MSNEEKNNLELNKTNYFKVFFNKLKKIKHLDIILTVLFIAIILLIYFSTSNDKKSDSITENKIVVEKTNDENNLINNYANEVEQKLCKVLSELKDVGKVSVAVKLSGNTEYIYAYTTKVEFLQDGTRLETKTPILSNEDGKPIVLQTILPSIESIVVIASGAKDTNVKLDILKIVELLYNLPSAKIEIFIGS